RGEIASLAPSSAFTRNARRFQRFDPAVYSDGIDRAGRSPILVARMLLRCRPLGGAASGSLKAWRDLVDERVDLGQLRADRTEHHIGAARVGQLLEPGDDVRIRAEHVAIAEVLEGTPRAHRAQEGLALGGIGFVARLGGREIGEIAMAEDEAVRVVARFARLLANQ